MQAVHVSSPLCILPMETKVLIKSVHCEFYHKTWFIGECGRDTGGVTRELWRFLGRALMNICEGQPNNLVFRHNAELVSVR